MLNSAATALVNTEPTGTPKRETIGRNLAAQYGNMEGKTESVKEQLESLNVINRDDIQINDRDSVIKMVRQSTTNEDGQVKLSKPVANNVTERKGISPGTDRNKRVLPMTPKTAMTPKSLYSSPSQSATSVTQSSEKELNFTPNSKRQSTSSLVSSASSNSSSVSSEPSEEDLFSKSNAKQTHIAVYKFVARHDDEMNLDTGDAVHVNKKCEDLWYEGINLRTGKAGVFPSRYVSDILQGASIEDNSNGAHVNQFSVRFLGSVEVNGFKGNEIICDAMREIVKQHQLSSTAKPPACILDVTERGIRILEHPMAGGKDSASIKKSRKGKLGKIFEKESKQTQKSHYFALKNVTFCGCHPHNARFFAFITKHPEDHRFACHVFMSEFSTEPVATAVGRAFKKFYADFLDYQAPVEDFYIE